MKGCNRWSMASNSKNYPLFYFTRWINHLPSIDCLWKAEFGARLMHWRTWGHLPGLQIQSETAACFRMTNARTWVQTREDLSNIAGNDEFYIRCVENIYIYVATIQQCWRSYLRDAALTDSGSHNFHVSTALPVLFTSFLLMSSQYPPG